MDSSVDTEKGTGSVELVERSHSPQRPRNDEEEDDYSGGGDENDDDVRPLVDSHGAIGSKRGALETDDGNDADDSAANAPLTSTEVAQMTVNIIIAFVGAGLLGMPQAFSRAGWFLGTVALCSISALNVYAMLLLPKVRRYLVATGLHGATATNCNSYGDVGRTLLGQRGEVLVNVCLIVSQMGFATAYLIFIAHTLTNLHHAPTTSRWKVCFGCVPGLALLVQARNMRYLSPFSLVANCANLVGLSAVLMQDYKTLRDRNDEQNQSGQDYLAGPSNETLPADSSDEDDGDDAFRAILWGGALYVMAITLYSMEGVGLILSLENSCRDRRRFPKLLSQVVCGITLFMAFFGIAGYAAFRSDTEAPITINLGSDSSAAAIVQGALCVALYFTYPMMMFPVWTIVEERMLEMPSLALTHEASQSSPELLWKRRGLRTVTVLTTAIVAYTVPDFGEYLSLVGSSICTVLGFILPTAFHLQVFGGQGHGNGDSTSEKSAPALGTVEYALNVFLYFGGALFAIVGTITSFRNMMAAEQS